MARNEEKAQAMLNRWFSLKKNLTDKPKVRRPFFAKDCNSVTDAEKFRSQIIKEISKKVTIIQNAGLGEARIRELNDEINKSLRQKNHWEDRIKELGGADYKRGGAKIIDSQGVEVPGSGGYKYFGAAKDLPGVRELFQRDVPAPPKQNRAELYKLINYEYYGLLQNEDVEMLEQEKQYEEMLKKQQINKWILENQALIKKKNVQNENDIIQLINMQSDNQQLFLQLNEQNNTNNINNNMQIEEQNTTMVEQNVFELEQKKKEILNKYFAEQKQKAPVQNNEEDQTLKDLIMMNKKDY